MRLRRNLDVLFETVVPIVLAVDAVRILSCSDIDTSHFFCSARSLSLSLSLRLHLSASISDRGDRTSRIRSRTTASSLSERCLPMNNTVRSLGLGMRHRLHSALHQHPRSRIIVQLPSGMRVSDMDVHAGYHIPDLYPSRVWTRTSRMLTGASI